MSFSIGKVLATSKGYRQRMSQMNGGSKYTLSIIHTRSDNYITRVAL